MGSSVDRGGWSTAAWRARTGRWPCALNDLAALRCTRRAGPKPAQDTCTSRRARSRRDHDRWTSAARVADRIQLRERRDGAVDLRADRLRGDPDLEEVGQLAVALDERRVPGATVDR